MTQQPIEVRGAQASEFPAIRELMMAAFGPDETDLWDCLVANHPAFSADGVRIAIKDGRPVAATVVFPSRVRTPRGWVGGATVTLVACHPDVQKQGYGGATVRDALDWMARRGLTVGLLYGHPGYYPRFGFVPVLPIRLTILPATPGDAGLLAVATEADLPVLNELYENHVAIYSGAMARDGMGWWAWRARQPEGKRVVLLADRTGYAVTSMNTKDGFLDVHEGAATSPAAARQLLHALCAAATERNLPNVRLIMPFDHLLARTAKVMTGAEQRYRNAAAGMAAIARWDNLLPRGYAVTDEGLCWGGRLLLQADQAALTQLVMGYRSAAELCLLPGVSLADPADGAQLERDFPAGQPRWSLEPFWE